MKNKSHFTKPKLFLGSFPAPLHVSVEAGEAGALKLSNTGAEPLRSLIGPEVENGAGRMFFVEQLGGKDKLVARFETELKPVRDLGAEVSERMAQALKARGALTRFSAEPGLGL